MADFEMTFTFAISLPPPKEEGKKKKGDKEKPKKKSKKETTEAEVPEEEKTTFKIDSKPFEFIHVNYCLIPSILEYEFDVAFWGPVAKIYTSGICRAIKTVIVNDGKVAWVSFSICHHLSLTTDDLTSLHGHELVFKIEPGQKKIGQKAKSDKPKVFQVIEECIGSNVLFAQLEETSSRPNTADVGLDGDQMAKPQSFLCGYPSRRHIRKVQDYIAEYSGEKFETLLPKKAEKEPTKSKEKKGQKEKKEKIEKKEKKEKKGKKEKSEKKDKKVKQEKEMGKGKGKKGDKSDSSPGISIHGELYFTDLKEISSQMECISPTILHASVVTTAANLLTEDQKIVLNPTIVRIERLICLPIKALQEMKYKEVFFKVHLYADSVIVTEQRPLAHEIPVYDTHSVIMSPPKLKSYFELLQTGNFLIEIYGVRDEMPLGSPIVYGLDCNNEITQRFPDHSQSITHKVRYAKACTMKTLLAIAHFDVSPILADHLKLDYWLDVKPLPTGDNILTSVGLRKTLLKVVVQQTLSVKEPLMVDIARGEHYNRMCLVCTDQLQASYVMRFINEINEGLVPKRTKVSGNILHNDPSLRSTLTRPLEKVYEDIFLRELGQDPIVKIIKNPAESVISGFVFSDHEYMILFFEGPANGKLQNLIHELKDQQYDHILIHYHSQLIFRNRLYKEYLRRGGFTIVVIDEPLRNKIARLGLMMEGALAGDVHQTLYNFYRLTNVKNIVEASRENLFPSPYLLKRLDAHFGVPMMLSADSGLFVPKRLHLRIIDAPRVSAFHRDDMMSGSREEIDIIMEEEEQELHTSSYENIDPFDESTFF